MNLLRKYERLSRETPNSQLHRPASGGALLGACGPVNWDVRRRRS